MTGVQLSQGMHITGFQILALTAKLTQTVPRALRSDGYRGVTVLVFMGAKPHMMQCPKQKENINNSTKNHPFLVMLGVGGIFGWGVASSGALPHENEYKRVRKSPCLSPFYPASPIKHLQINTVTYVIFSIPLFSGAIVSLCQAWRLLPSKCNSPTDHSQKHCYFE